MKLRLFFSFALLCLSVLIIQSCTSENSTDDEFETSAFEIENEDVDIAPLVEYCIYIVQSSTTGLYPKGSKFCTTCTKPKCKEFITVKPTVDGKKKTVNGRRTRASCRDCSDGLPII